MSNYIMECLKPSNSQLQCELLRIEMGVLVTTILLLGVFVTGFVRRRIHGSWPGFCIILLHSLITILIPFLLGLMRSANSPNKVYPIWACFLLFAYGGFDTMTARNLSDNENFTHYIMYYFSLCLWVGVVAGGANIFQVKNTSDIVTMMAYISLSLLGIWNIVETGTAFAFASKSNGLPGARKQTDDHMCDGFINSNTNEEEATVDDAVSMRGYPYLVDGTKESNNIVTTTQVWQCVDQLLPTPTYDGNIRRLNESSGARIKDICLSRALFNILLMRCAGYSLEESSRNKSRRFVEDGFLSIGDPRKMQERVFTIVEWELEFLFDFFYTKFYFTSTAGFAYKLKRLAGILICVWFAVEELRRKTREKFIGPNIVQLHGHSVEVGVTRTVIIVIAIGEAVQLCMRIFSNWTIVKLICLYAMEPHTKKTFLIEKAIKIISFVKYYLLAKGPIFSWMLKPWKRELGQYSLLKSYDKVPMLNRVLRPLYSFFPKYPPRVAQEESSAVGLSMQVKGAVISSLADYGFALSWGKSSLARNGLADQLSSFCSAEPEGDAYVILVWHIATSICEHHFSSHILQSSDEHFRVATQLSKYCAYLVVFAPELLSGLPYKTQTTVLDTIQCAHEKLKDTADMAGRCSKLVLADQQLLPVDEQDMTIFGRATVLAHHLRNIFLDDPNRGWRVMAEFWVELILYLAPTENSTAHVENLAKGGEFITLLWALLTNAGITSRAHFLITL